MARTTRNDKSRLNAKPRRSRERDRDAERTQHAYTVHNTHVHNNSNMLRDLISRKRGAVESGEGPGESGGAPKTGE
jgi:hypothetical protein